MTDFRTPEGHANSDLLDPELLQKAAEAKEAGNSFPRRSITFALYLLPLAALANVGALIWSLDNGLIAERLVAPQFLILAALLAFVPMITNSIRLTVWCRFLGVEMTFFRALKVITGTMVTNSITPSATGSMPIKMLFLIGEGVELRSAITLLSFQTAEDALVLFSLVGICLGLTGFAMLDFLISDPELYAEAAAALTNFGVIAAWVLAGTIVTLVLLSLIGGAIGRKLRGWLRAFVRVVRSNSSLVASDWAAVARRGRGVALINLGLALVQWCVRFSIAGLVLAAFGTIWIPELYWLLQYGVQSISSIVPTPGGAGGAEAAFLVVFAPFVDGEVLLPAMSAWRLVFFYTPLVAAALVFFLINRKRRKAGEPIFTPPASGPPADKLKPNLNG